MGKRIRRRKSKKEGKEERGTGGGEIEEKWASLKQDLGEEGCNFDLL